MSSVVWLFLLLGVIWFVLSLLFMTATLDLLRSDAHPEEKAKIKSWFGSLNQSYLSLFKAISGGMNWDEIGDTLLRINLLYGLAFLAFVVFVVFGAMNAITGVFVENTLANAQQEKDKARTNAKSLIRDLDFEKKGCVSKEEFHMLMSTRAIQELFTRLSISPEQALGLFDLMDRDGAGFLKTECLENGLFQMTGELARSDITISRLENRIILKELTEFFVFCENYFQSISSCFGTKHREHKYERRNMNDMLL